MSAIPDIMKLIAVVIAAGIIGNWFLKEVRTARRSGKPWYAPYLTPPGVLILFLLTLPIWLKLFKA